MLNLVTDNVTKKTPIISLILKLLILNVKLLHA